MPLIGSILPQKVVGLQHDERKARRAKDEDKEAAKASFRKVMDEADLTVEHVESIDELRRVSGNETEESHEDRVGHHYYDPHTPHPGDAHGGLDVRG